MFTHKILAATTALVLLTGCSMSSVMPNDDNIRTVKIKNENQASPIDAYNNLAASYFQTQNIPAAKSAVTRSLEIEPNNAISLNLMALILRAENDPVNSEMYFRKALSIDANNPMLVNNYGSFLFWQERFSEACVQFDKAANLNLRYPARNHAFENLGLCYLELQDEEKAKNAFKRSVDINPREKALTEYIILLRKHNEPYAAYANLLDSLLRSSGNPKDTRL